MNKYKLDYNNAVVDTETGAIIPKDENNEHWQAYLAWVAEGNAPDPQFSSAELDEQRIAKIKEEAGKKIVSSVPEWKQRNQLATLLELVVKAVDMSVLTDDEQAIVAAIQAEWDQIKAVREASDTAEASGTDPENIIWPL